MALEREVEQEYRPRMLEALEQRVNALAEELLQSQPSCRDCGGSMKQHDRRTVSWRARFGKLKICAWRYGCRVCGNECRPVLDVLGVEAGRIRGPLAGLVELLAVGATYDWTAEVPG